MFKFLGKLATGLVLKSTSKMSTKEAIELMELTQIRSELEKQNRLLAKRTRELERRNDLDQRSAAQSRKGVGGAAGRKARRR